MRTSRMLRYNCLLRKRARHSRYRPRSVTWRSWIRSYQRDFSCHFCTPKKTCNCLFHRRPSWIHTTHAQCAKGSACGGPKQLMCTDLNFLSFERKQNNHQSCIVGRSTSTRANLSSVRVFTSWGLARCLESCIRVRDSDSTEQERPSEEFCIFRSCGRSIGPLFLCVSQSASGSPSLCPPVLSLKTLLIKTWSDEFHPENWTQYIFFVSTDGDIIIPNSSLGSTRLERGCMWSTCRLRKHKLGKVKHLSPFTFHRENTKQKIH